MGLFNTIRTMRSFVTNTTIRKELMRLVIAQLEACVVREYYTDQITRLLTEKLESTQALTEAVKVEGLSDEEREKLSFRLRQVELEGQACMEVTTLIRRLADKAQRKANEAEQRLNAFCKRYGIDNVDEYVKSSM